MGEPETNDFSGTEPKQTFDNLLDLHQDRLIHPFMAVALEFGTIRLKFRRLENDPS